MDKIDLVIQGWHGDVDYFTYTIQRHLIDKHLEHLYVLMRFPLLYSGCPNSKRCPAVLAAVTLGSELGPPK